VLADKVVEALETLYRTDSPVVQRADAQQKVFNVLCSLENKGYDVTRYFGRVADVLLYKNK
jgi:hypothetical protein